MLSARNTIVAVIVVLLLSTALATVSLVGDRLGGGKGADSWGIRAYGHRALFELLEETGVPVKRRVRPPSADLPLDTTVVLWAPHEPLVDAEPYYLRQLGEWVKQGGRLVVAPQPKQGWAFSMAMHDADLLVELGLEDTFVSEPLAPDATAADQTQTVNRAKVGEDAESEPDFDEEFRRAWGARQDEGSVQWTGRHVRMTGTLRSLRDRVEGVYLPVEPLQVIQQGSDTPQGRMILPLTAAERAAVESVKDAADLEALLEPHTIAASWQLGKGELVVVADPRLLQNDALARADNAVFAYDVLAGETSGVVFDEFYHGSAVRGNALWLLTRPAYATMTVLLLVVVALWAWRSGIVLGPALSAAPAARRNIGEYVEAMGRYFNRGRRSRDFLLEEAWQGTLRTLGEELRLRPGKHKAEEILSVLEHRRPQRAARFREAVRAYEELAARRKRVDPNAYVCVVRDLTACLQNDRHVPEGDRGPVGNLHA